MAEVFLLRRYRNLLERSSIQRRWRLQDRENPFELNSRLFRQKFRLSKDAVFYLCREISTIYETEKGYNIEMQVLHFLKIMGSGNFQHNVGDDKFNQTSQSSCSRFMGKLLDALFLLKNKFISFPRNDQEILQTCRKFYQKFSFPNVIGAIDCTHIQIQKPSTEDSHAYRNRKGDKSINVQMVSDANLRIMDVVARWPGSTHDAYIWSFSGLRRHLSQNYVSGEGYLLGDSGYPLEPWLLTPYHSPIAAQEVLYNKKHAKARNTIERCFGVMKSRFRILHESGGTISYNPQKICKIIIAAAILHNICLQFNVELEDPPVLDNDDDFRNDNVTLNAADIRDNVAMNFQMLV